MATIRADITPELLNWARRSAGFSLEDAARKIGGPTFKPERLAAWESGETKPTVKQLIKLARIYRRPVGTFYLSTLPIDFTIPHDFRRLPGVVAGTYSPPLRQQIRAVEERREIALQLLSEIGAEPPVFPISATINDDAEGLAQKIRELLGVTLEEQIKWQDPQRYKALNEWRRRVEDIGVLVFQLVDVEVDEMLGLSIAERVLPAIAVNRKLRPNGRIFTLLHEFVHLALGRSGICDLDETAARPPEEQPTEVFCNRVAGAVLVPSDDLLMEPIISSQTDTPRDWDEAQLGALADRYSVSREVIVRRLLTLNRTTPAFYQRKREEYEVILRAREARKKKGGYESRAGRAVSTLGHGYIRLILETYYPGRITLSDVSAYTGERLKHLPKIEKAVGPTRSEALQAE